MRMYNYGGVFKNCLWVRWTPSGRRREGTIMGQPVVHFEIIGTDPARLRGYYGELFGWQFDTSGPVSDQGSEPGGYGFVETDGIPGGVGGGGGYESHVVFYVGVPDVVAALA